MGRKVIFTPEFEEAMRHYPDRSPDNPRRPAFSAWTARIDEGESPATLTACVKSYADHCRRAGKLGTEFVLQAQTFFGVNYRYRAFLPKTKPTPTPAARTAVDEPAEPKADPVEARRWLREIVDKLKGGLRPMP